MNHGDKQPPQRGQKKIARFLDRLKMTMKKGGTSRDTGRRVEEEEASAEPWDFPDAVDADEHPSLCTDRHTHVTNYVDDTQVNSLKNCVFN